MMKLSKQNIIVLVVCIAALSLLFVFHFHNGSDAAASHLTMSSQVNLRGLENAQKISQMVSEPLSLHRSPSVVSAPRAAPEIGEFGSPAPLADTTVDSHQPKNDSSASITSSSSNVVDTTATADLAAHEHQFAIDNLRNGPTADHDHDHGADAVASAEEAASVATTEDDKAAVSAVPTALPTRVPTEPPLMTLAPTLAPTLAAPVQATASPTAPPAEATPAPTAEPPFEAQTFSGQADQEVSWAAVRDAYANDFFAFAQQLDAVADVLPSSSTELVHSALKKGAIKASAAGLNAGSGGSSDSTLSDALLDAVASLRPGTVVTYAYASTAATLIPKLAKRIASFPIVSHVFRSPGGSGGVATLPPHFANVLTLHHTSPATGRQAAPLDCVQTLEDFTLLVHEQLPFEFEDAVHRFLCQCNVTYLPKTLPPTPYFAAWDAVETLIDHAAHHVEQPTCQLAFLPSATLTEKYASLVRYSHLLVTRNATAPATAASTAANASFWRLDDLAQLPLSTASAVSLASSLVQRWATQPLNDTSAAGTDEALFWVGKALLNDAEATTLLAKGKAPTRVVHVDYVANRLPTVARQLRHNASDTAEQSSTASDALRQRRRLYTTSGGGSSSSRYDEVDHIDGGVPHVLWLAHDTVGSDDAVLMAMMRTLQEQPAATVAKDTTSGGPRMSLTKATRTAQAQLYRDENDNYRFWMQLVRDGHVATAETGRRVLGDLQHVHRVNGTLAVWGRDVGLFSTKLAMLLQRDTSLPPSSMLQVTVLSDAAAASTADTLYKLNAVMNVPHNVIATPAAWSASFFVAMAQSRVAWDVSLVETDVWLQLLAAALADLPLSTTAEEEEAAAVAVETAFVQRTALFLATSRVTYWKLPASRRLWTQVLTLLLGAPPTATRRGQRLLALLTQPADVFQRIADVWAGRQRLAVDVVPTATPRHVRVYRFEVIAVSGRSQTTTLLPRGLSLHALSWLQLIPAQRKMVLSLVVQLPLWILRHDEWSQTQGEGQQQQTAAEEVRAMVEAVSVRDIYLRRHVQTGDWEVAVQNIGHFAAEHTIGSRVSRDTSPEITTAHGVWSALRTEFAAHPAEMAQGRFSFLEYHSGLGLISTRLAYAYPDATIFSVEADDTNTERHLQLAAAFNVSNDAVCHLEMDRGSLHRHLYESPELFRFQLFFNNALQQFQETNDLDEWGKHLGAVLSSALTTFVYVPNRALVSLGLYALFGVYCRETDAATAATTAAATGEWHCRSVATHGRGVYVDVDELFAPSSSTADTAATAAAEREGRWDVRGAVVAEEWHRLTTLAAHPQRFFVNFHSDWLLATARAQSLGSESSVMFSPLALNRGATTTAGGIDGGNADAATAAAAVAYNGALDFPMMRCDIVNMTRHVHHHFDYARDGHSRTYTMRIGVNQTETRRVRDVVAQYTGAASADDVDIAQLQPQVDRDGVHLTWPASTTTAVTLPLGHHACQHHVTSVKLYRDKDNWPIPYVSIYGVTLITALRMGLKTKLRDRLFHEFLRLPLYEDMAPWNIVLFGSTVDYIDYDTKDVTFDLVLPKAYQSLARIAEQVSERARVAAAAGGGTALSSGAMVSAAAAADPRGGAQRQQHQWAQDLASAMKAVVAKFNSTTYEKIAYEDFMARLQEMTAATPTL